MTVQNLNLIPHAEDAIICHVPHASAAVEVAIYQLALRETLPVIVAAHIDHGDFTASLSLPDGVRLVKIRSEDCLTISGHPPGCEANNVISAYPDYAYFQPYFERFRSTFHLYYDALVSVSLSELMKNLREDDCHAAFFHHRNAAADLPKFGAETEDHNHFYLLGYGLNDHSSPHFYPPLSASLAYAYLSKTALATLRHERDEQVFIARKENISFIPASVFASASCAIRRLEKVADLAGFLKEESFYHARYMAIDITDPISSLRIDAENKAFTPLLTELKAKYAIQSELQSATAAQSELRSTLSNGKRRTKNI